MQFSDLLCFVFVLIMCRQDDVAAVDVNMGCPKEYSTKVNAAILRISFTI